MTKYDCVDCKRSVEIVVPVENICTDCYVVQLKLQIIKLSLQVNQVSATQALLERWLEQVESYSVKNRDIIQDTKTLLEEAKEV